MCPSRDGTISGAVEVGIRPEHLRIVDNASADASLKGMVSIIERLGNSTILYVETPAGQLIFEGDGALVAQPGDNLSIVVDCKTAHLFGANNRVV